MSRDARQKRNAAESHAIQANNRVHTGRDASREAVMRRALAEELARVPRQSPEVRPGGNRSRRIRTMDDVPPESMKNALHYLQCLYNPLEADAARIPDLLSFPTGLTKSVTRANVVLVANGTGFGCQLAVSPLVGGVAPGVTNMDGCKIRYTSAYAAQLPSASVVVPDDIGGAAGAAVTNWSLVRTVAMGVRVIPISSEQKSGGLLTVESLPYMVSPQDAATQDNAWQSNDNADEAPLSASASSDRVCVDFAAIWRPNTYRGGLDFLPPASASQPVSSIYITLTGDAATAYTVEVTTIYEFQPKPTTAVLFDLKRAPGSLGDVAKIDAEIVARVPGSHRPAASHNVWGALKSVGKWVSGALSYVPGPVGSIASAISKLF